MPNRSFTLGCLSVRWLNHCSLIIVLLAFAILAVAAEDPPQSNKANVDQLIKQLGDPSFTVRENATESLTLLGSRAQQELKRALLNPDLEIRMRAHRILLKSLQSEFAAKIAAFISDVDGKQEHDLPGWKQFRKTIGSDRNTRILFADMVRRESEILESFETGKNLEPALLKRLTELRPGNGINRPKQPQPPMIQFHKSSKSGLEA